MRLMSKYYYMKEDLNKPKKPRKRTRKAKANKPSSLKTSEQDELNRLLKLTRPNNRTIVAIADQELLDPEIEAAIQHALKNYTVESGKAHKMRSEEMGALEATVSEFMKNFIIIGYDLAGEKIQMMHARNPQEYDSLIECARGSLLTLMIKAQQQLPGLPPPGSDGI